MVLGGDLMLTKEMLRSLREQKGLTGKQVAEGIGIAYPVYQTYESGARNAGLPVVEKLADFYGVTTDYLLGRVPAETETLTASENALEQRLLEQYYKLPEQYRKKCLEGVIQAVELQKQQEAAEQNKLPHSATIGELLEAATENEAKNGA